MGGFGGGGRTRVDRLLIVDRDVLLADALAAAAEDAGFSDVQVIAGAEMVPRYVQKQPPTVLLAGLDLAIKQDCRLLGAVKRESPASRVVLIVDDSHDEGPVIEGLVAGARGVVYRNQGMDSLLRVLEVVRGGGVAIPRCLSEAMLEALRQRPVERLVEVQLSERQRAVLDLAGRGLSDKEIGDELMISPATVRSHMKSIFEKIGVNNRVDATHWAARQAGCENATP